MKGGPKLYTSKPRKGQLKPQTEEGRPLSQAPIEQPKPPVTMPSPAPSSNESFARRYKFLDRLFHYNLPNDERGPDFTKNATKDIKLNCFNDLGAVKLFLNGNQKDVIEADEAPMPADNTTVHSFMEEALTQSTGLPAIPPKRVAEDDQRKLFKWMLEEKRKVKVSNLEEQKRLDEEKAILKQFISSKSIPAI